MFVPPVLGNLDISSNNQIVGWSSGQMPENTGFNIDSCTHNTSKILSVPHPTAFRLYFEGSQGEGCVTLRSRTLQDQRSHFFEREFGCTAIFYPFND